MMRRRSAPLTTSSTSALGPASTAARSWSRARLTTSSRASGLSPASTWAAVARSGCRAGAGVFTQVRETFAQVPEARIRGYQAGRFSFNVKGGRCEACRGEGIIQIEMQFLPDVYVPCEVCKGKRYNREALEIKYKGKSIADVLEMTVEEAVDFFQNMPAIKSKMAV